MSNFDPCTPDWSYLGYWANGLLGYRAYWGHKSYWEIGEIKSLFPKSFCVIFAIASCVFVCKKDSCCTCEAPESGWYPIQKRKSSKFPTNRFFDLINFPLQFIPITNKTMPKNRTDSIVISWTRPNTSPRLPKRITYFCLIRVEWGEARRLLVRQGNSLAGSMSHCNSLHALTGWLTSGLLS